MEENLPVFDVCIIGGNISGNYLCYLLSHTKLKIAVIEEHKEIGLPFQCAGIVSKKLSELISLPLEIILNRVKIAKVVAPSGKYIKLGGEEEPYIIDRVAFDKLFYEKVNQKENITYFLGERFESFKYSKKNREKKIIIQTSKRKIKAKMIIGCDGPLSTVGKLLNIKNKVIYGTQIRVKANYNPNEAVMFFNPHWKELFGWIVPEGNNHIYRIGMGAAIHIHKKFKNYLKILKINNNAILDRQGGIIPYGMMNKCAFENCLLLGDAAGQVKATTGGGIVMLLTAAKYAASCIKKCFKSNNFSQKFIKKHYENQCSATIGHQLKIHFIIRKIFEHFTSDDYEMFFQIVKISHVEELISLYGDMDFPRTLFIKLLKNSLVFKFLLKFFRKNPLLVFKLLKILIIHE
ncbi:MAG: geranylgeranyl reductase family protein [Promethearchaeota archaeon]